MLGGSAPVQKDGAKVRRKLKPHTLPASAKLRRSPPGMIGQDLFSRWSVQKSLEPQDPPKGRVSCFNQYTPELDVREAARYKTQLAYYEGTAKSQYSYPIPLFTGT